MRTYNLNGTEGNSYYLLGLARDWMLQFEWDVQTIESVLNSMKSSDYDHLLKVFDDSFSDIVEYKFINDPRK